MSRVLRDLALLSPRPRRFRNRKRVWGSPHKKVKTILFWLCGIWATGIGIRMLAELLIVGDFLVFANALSILLDFAPLTILGCLSIAIILKDRVSKAAHKKAILSHLAGYEG